MKYKFLFVNNEKKDNLGKRLKGKKSNTTFHKFLNINLENIKENHNSISHRIKTEIKHKLNDNFNNKEIILSTNPNIKYIIY